MTLAPAAALMAVAVTGGASSLRRADGGAPLTRTLGFYIAGCAGSIQVLDIFVDRLPLPERLLLAAIILAVIGLPLVAAATVLLHAAKEDQRTAAATRPEHVATSPAPTSGRSPAFSPPWRPGSGAGGTPDGVPRTAESPANSARSMHADRTRSGGVARSESRRSYEELTRRVELALSYHRIATLEQGEHDGTTDPHLQAFVDQAEQAIADLQALVTEARSRHANPNHR